MKDEKRKAICLNRWATVREIGADRYMLFTPSDATEAGHFIPSNEIFLHREEVEQLALFAGVLEHSDE